MLLMKLSKATKLYHIYNSPKVKVGGFINLKFSILSHACDLPSKLCHNKSFSFKIAIHFTIGFPFSCIKSPTFIF